MLETIREYASEVLSTLDLALTARQHALHYLELAEAARLGGADHQFWLDRLEADYENLRAALGWAFESDEASLALRLVVALSIFWEKYHPRYIEAWEWHQRAVSIVDSDSDDSLDLSLRAQTLHWAGRAATYVSEYDHEIALLGRAVDAFRELGDEAAVSAALRWLGTDLYWVQGDAVAAKTMLDEAVVLARRVGENELIAPALHNRALLNVSLGRATAARGDFEEALALFRQSGDKGGMANTLVNLGSLAVVEDRYREADELLEEGLTVARDINGIAWLCN
jgi:tetratricopeptide (TPR) repeat protein